MIALTDFGSSDPNIKQASKDLVETTLERIAPTLYRGVSLAYADISSHSNMMNKIGLTKDKLPAIYTIMQESGNMLVYNDEMTEDGIRVWAQDIIKGAYS